MDTDLLRTFEMICAKGTTQATAEALGISQPSVSRRLSLLEQQFDVLLFVREKGRLIPTRENIALRGQISSFLAQSDRLTNFARELGHGKSPAINLRVAFPASLTLSIVPQIVVDFVADNENVQIEIHTAAYDTIERMLLDERAEIGFLRMPTMRPGLDLMPFIEVGTVCVMPKNHPLADKSEISLTDLHGQDLILLGRHRKPRHEIDDLFLAHGFSPKVRVEAHSVMSACARAAQGLGVTLVNGLMAQDYIHLPIKILPLTQPMRHRFAFAKRQNAVLSTPAAQFIKLAEKRFKSLSNGSPGK